MTVKLERGQATVPLWAAITLIVSVLVTSTSIAIAAKANASSADHTAIMEKIAAEDRIVVANEERAKLRETRIAALEQSMASLRTDMDYLKATLVRIERKIDR